MSSIFSDPGWSRGRTLLQGEVIDYDDAPTNTVPTAGKEIVGQVKVFQDVHPITGTRNSNRLVYCVAARYTGSTALTSADAGKVYAFSTTRPLAEFSAVATAENINTDGRSYGVLDEYLNVTVRQNDIVWLVVKGPTQIQSSGTAIAAGAAIEVTGTAGRVTTKNTGVTIANQIEGSSVGGTAGALVRANVHNDEV